MTTPNMYQAVEKSFPKARLIFVWKNVYLLMYVPAWHRGRLGFVA